MYCQHCGAEAPQDLNYCKRCGGNLNPLPNFSALEVSRPARVSPFAVASIALATFGMVVGGLLALFGMLYNMSSGPNGLRGAAVVWLAALGALTILGGIALLMRLATMLFAGRQQASGSDPSLSSARPASISELGGQRISALPGASPASVTEHATRTFEPSYKEPRLR